ncbi:hypothetical protein NZD89_25925 [Alicyclobacillus fastidiosus]|uniref:Uncharacterized protein n=1 Tax=Alicyclobacillus fastidiosus TaxID=392011 RepID=A0ABY6ZGA3_9BACL|nr:hypothetical protein [Alicyclobacillus fastidiosus]WAH41613.1 hypothetical protein NZD89_25925 [Alicyclobacillus fastidiosus]
MAAWDSLASVGMLYGWRRFVSDKRHGLPADALQLAWRMGGNGRSA